MPAIPTIPAIPRPPVMPSAPTMPHERVTEHIVVIRSEKVLLDHDLAALYGVETKVLVQAVKRNGVRFPGDFMFQLDGAEWDALRSQSVTSNIGRGGRRYPPYAFTEQGVAMLSSVLSSPEAVAVNIAIMRAFVKLRKALATNEQLARQFEELVRKVNTHDQALSGLIHSLRSLMQAEREAAALAETTPCAPSGLFIMRRRNRRRKLHR